MKYKGKSIQKKNQEIIPISRPDGDIIFVATAIPNWDEFEKLVPEPQAPEIIKPGRVKFTDKQDPKYLKALDEYNTQRTVYLILASLQDSPDLEWETVDLQKPETWKNYKKELLESGITEIEEGQITLGVMRANSLDENMIAEARSNFLRGVQGSKT